MSTPDVTHHRVAVEEDKFIVLACDGLYDVFSNEQCMEWMKENNLKSMTTQKLTDKLCNDAIYVRKSKDNVSILIIRLDHREVDELNQSQLKPSCTETTVVTQEIVDFDGQEVLIEDTDHSEHKEAEEHDIKIYNSISSTTTSIASIGASITETEDVEESLNDSLSSGQSQDQIMQIADSVSPKKHKFHVSMVEDDDDGNEMDCDPAESD